MIKNLKYKVTFTNPEKTITRDLNFLPGLTGIVGPNGQGKTLNIEMIKYALHGTEALRAPKSEYKELDVSMTFEVRKVGYLINRSFKKTSLIEEKTGETMAAGTTAVNAAILNIFGYGPSVFLVANAVDQGQVETLGNMRPAERKALVDETIGLNALDALTQYIVDEARDLNAMIKATEKGLVEPKAPEACDLEPSWMYQVQEKDLREKQMSRATLQAKLSIPLPEKPVFAEEHPEAGQLADLEMIQRERDELMARKRVAEGDLAKFPEQTGWVDVELDPDDSRLEEYQELAARRKLLSERLSDLGPAPVWDQEKVDRYLAAKTLERRWVEKQNLVLKSVPHDCPACHHHWEDEDPRIKSEYGDVPDEQPVIVNVTDAQLKEAQQRLDREPRRTALLKELNEIPVNADDIAKRILRARAAIKANQTAYIINQRRNEILGTLDAIRNELQKMPSVSEKIQDIKDASAAVEKFKKQTKIYNEAMELRGMYQLLLDEIPKDLDEQIAAVQRNLIRAVQYEAEVKQYEKDFIKYAEAMDRLTDDRRELKDWEKGKKAVVDLRARVKGYLLPSLNSVASSLINEMTGGVLSWIVVNEDFEITVEGQKLETLSGSGKAVANLALRIALGQILTNRVFSVLLLDEIDASCDEDRAQYIAGCLQRLTGGVKQIIQVSHKEGLVSDQRINLGEA